MIEHIGDLPPTARIPVKTGFLSQNIHILGHADHFFFLQVYIENSEDTQQDCKGGLA
jgi:hypothetical protein